MAYGPHGQGGLVGEPDRGAPLHRRLRRLAHRLRRVRSLVPRQPEDQAALIHALNVVAASVSAAADVREVLGTIVEAAKRFTGTEKVLICLTDQDVDGCALDETTVVVRGRRDTHQQSWWSGRLADVATEVFADGRPYFETAEEHDAWLLGVPVSLRDEPLGVLVAINSTDHRLKPEHTAFLSILGAFAATAIANARLIEDSRYALLASERERISREMHDGISQSLFSISLGLDLCRKQVVRDPEGVARRLEEIQELLRASMGELRRYIYDLRPAKLQELGLVDSIDLWIREVTAGRPLSGGIEVRGEPVTLSPTAEACLYRVAKEAVSNVVRHSGAERFTVTIEYVDGSVRLSVSDDGDGFKPEAALEALPGTRMGLRSMRERVATEGGTLTITSAPGEGTVICAELPTGG